MASLADILVMLGLKGDEPNVEAELAKRGLVSAPTQTLGGKRMDGARPMTIQEKTLREDPLKQMGRDAGAFASNAINTAGMGVPGIVLDTVAPEGVSKAVRDNEALATGIGNVGGVMAGMATPGGLGSILARAPKTAATAAGMFGLTASPSRAGSEEKANSGLTDDYEALLTRQASLQKRLDAARAKMDSAKATMDNERRTGVGPNFKAAADKFADAKLEFEDVDTQVKSLQPMLAKASQMRDPAYQIELDKKRQAAESERKQKTMNTSVKEMFADVAPYAPVVSAGLAAMLGRGITGSYVNKYNTAINDLNTRWKGAVDAGNKPLAIALENEVKALADKGAGGTIPSVLAGIGAGEFGQVLPIAADYAKAVPGSDLYKKTTDSMSNPWEVGGRALTGAMLGGIPAEIASVLMKRNVARPAGYSAETRALLSPPTPRPGPPSPPPSPQNSPNGPGLGPQGPSPALAPNQAGTAANSNVSLSDLLKSGDVTTADMLNAMNIKPANMHARPKGLPDHLDVDDRLKGSKVRNKETGLIEPDPTKKP